MLLGIVLLSACLSRQRKVEEVMGYLTIKPEADKDFYVIWSSISDLPCLWGTSHDLLTEAVKDQFRGKHTKYGIFGDNYWDVLVRVDERGTSSRISNGLWEEDFDMPWGGYGTITSPENLHKILELIEKGKDSMSKKVLKYVEKYDWEDD